MNNNIELVQHLLNNVFGKLSENEKNKLLRDLYMTREELENCFKNKKVTTRIVRYLSRLLRQDVSSMNDETIKKLMLLSKH